MISTPLRQSPLCVCKTTRVLAAILSRNAAIVSQEEKTNETTHLPKRFTVKVPWVIGQILVTVAVNVAKDFRRPLIQLLSIRNVSPSLQLFQPRRLCSLSGLPSAADSPAPDTVYLVCSVFLGPDLGWTSGDDPCRSPPTSAVGSCALRMNRSLDLIEMSS